MICTLFNFYLFCVLESLFKNEKGFCFCLQLFRMTEKPNQILYIQYVILCYLENRDVPQKFILTSLTQTKPSHKMSDLHGVDCEDGHSRVDTEALQARQQGVGADKEGDHVCEGGH